MAIAGYGQPVVNASVSGETTTGGLSRIGHLLSTRHPAVMVLELGANDALRGLPPEVIEGNLIALTQAAQKAGARVLLVGTPLPANYGAEYGRSVARAFVNAARRTKTPLVPSLFSRIEVREENFQADRLHPVAAVQDRMLDCVWPSLQPLLLKTTP
jgi:acyl-CoA thioesterase-1